MFAGQRSWQGVTFGHPTDDIQIDSETGLDDLLVRSESSPIPRYHGSIPGDHTADQKQVIVSLWWAADTKEAAEDIALTARGLFQVSRMEQFPYGFQHHSGVERVVFARCVRRSQPRNRDTEAGLGVYKMTVELEVVDPVIYSAAVESDTLTPFVSATGFSWPIMWPVSWGAGGSGGTGSVSNDGDWESWPTFTITGPSSGTLSNPIIENVSTGQRLALNANGGVQMSPGQQLVIETHPANRSVAFSTGASRRGKLSDDSEWFPLEPGVTQLRFRASGSTTDASVLVQARSAWL